MIPIKSSKCRFNNPSFWDSFKFCHIISTFHYFKSPATGILAPAINLPPYSPSAPVNVNRVAVTATFDGTHLAPSGSGLSAAWTDKLGINSNLSTRRCPFLAFIFCRHHSLWAPCSVVFTVWLSIILALASFCLVPASPTSWPNFSSILGQRPLFFHGLK